MAKRKSSGNVPQPQFKENHTPSQHDRRERLLQPNPNRQPTVDAKFPLIGGIAVLVGMMQRSLDARTAFRFSILFAGMFLAKGRRTVSSWFRGAGVGDDWDKFYESLQAIGKCPKSLMQTLLRTIVKHIGSNPDQYLTIAIDDSPTERFGKHVEGANIHHNPTPGPGDHEWLYGHTQLGDSCNSYAPFQVGHHCTTDTRKHVCTQSRHRSPQREAWTGFSNKNRDGHRHYDADRQQRSIRRLQSQNAVGR